jgi:glycerol-3-phosphate dehydrogenase
VNIAVIGGGINGVMTAWAFARRGYAVDLYEKGGLMSATSRSSTKMLHGGLRYLEHGHFGLVREALQERSWWIRQAPDLARPLELLLPVFEHSGRPKWLLGAGIRIYDLLAAGSGFPRGRWYSVAEVAGMFPRLKGQGLLGAYGYWDAQMDDYRLGLWAAAQAKAAGVRIHEQTPVKAIEAESGRVSLADTEATFDRVINAAGPWAEKLLDSSDISSGFRLDLVRGSHLVIRGKLDKGCVLQVPGEKRVLFVLPHGRNTLLGTTEIGHADPDSCAISEEEVDYLLTNYNRYFDEALVRNDIVESFSGVRPIVASRSDFSAASRESVIARQGKLINVFGGKWTTSRSLAEAVVRTSLH